MTFVSEMVPKFSAIPSTVGATRLQSETANEATEFGLLPEPNPIRKAASESVPVQLLTLTVSMLNRLAALDTGIEPHQGQAVECAVCHGDSGDIAGVALRAVQRDGVVPGCEVAV